MGIKINNEGFTEAQACAVYFLTNNPEFNTRGYSIIVDIGGATSDISCWNNRRMVWEDSVKFGGNDLTYILNDLIDFFIKIINQELKDIKDLDKSASKPTYDFLIRIWPLVHDNWNGYMEHFLSEDYSNKILQKICFFYSAICYYIGLHLKTKKVNEPLNQLAFAGNGIRFLEIVTNGSKLSDEQPALRPWIKLFKEIIKVSHDLKNNSYETNLIFSSEPKFEIAKGLTGDNLEKYTTQEHDRNVSKMLGIDLKIGDKTYSYDKWYPDLKASQISGSGVKINYDIFLSFLRNFRNLASELFPEWDLTHFTIEFNKKMEDRFFNSLENRGDNELATPLFFEAWKAYMHYFLSNELSDNKTLEEKNEIFLKYNGKQDSKEIFIKTEFSEYFYAKQLNNEWQLFVTNKILNKKPSQEYEILLEKFFEIEKIENPNRYELEKSAELEFDLKNENWILKNKGKIKQV